jgi:membrane protein DedA with SNARE-associated domain/rhodanese-related sulfurtransferase
LDLIDLVTRWGVPLVVVAVLLEQGGFPLPAAPLMVVAGALAGAGTMRPEHVLGAALVACLIADHLWFAIGRRAGRRVLGTICKMSLSPDTCVRQTDDLVARHGLPLLVVAKFIPAVSAVAIPTVAAMGVSWRRFIAFDGMGAVLWTGAYIGGGMIFSREVTRLLDSMSVVGGYALVILAVLVILYISLKVLHRMSLKRLHRLVRISPAEVADLMETDPLLVIVDARSEVARAEDPRVLPRSVMLGNRSVGDVLSEHPKHETVVTFCTCPSEASAALLAEQLIKSGYRRVRVLTGGTDALHALSGPARDIAAD